MRSRSLFTLLNRRHHRTIRRQKSPGARLGHSASGLFALLSLLVVAGFLLLAFGYANLTTNLPSIETIPVLLNPQDGILLQPTRMYDRTGQTLLVSLENTGIERRYLTVDPSNPEHFSPYLVQTIISMVDPGFWLNPGFSWQELTHPQPITLGEHLVNDLLLQNEAPGLHRTLRMRLLAAQIVAHYGRSQVLEWYLNSAYFGHLAYGADSAARLYLSKSAADLNLAESALLGALIESPALNPLDSPAAAREQEQNALDQLGTQSVYNAQEIAQAKETLLTFQTQQETPLSLAPVFTQLVIKQLTEQLGQAAVERGGLKVVTTLDLNLQNQVICTLKTQLERLEGNTDITTDCPASLLLPTLPPSAKALPHALTTSAILIDPQTGDILAWVGDSTLDETDNLVQLTQNQVHQPGSLLAPFAALAAFRSGFSPASLLWDIPDSLPENLQGFNNPDRTFHGPQRLRLVLANDYSIALSKLLVQIGSKNAWRLSEPLGLGNLVNSSSPDTLLLGGGDVSLSEMAQAYSVFANLGSQNGRLSPVTNALEPDTIMSVEETSGRVLIGESPPDTRSLVSAQLAYLVHDILNDENAPQASLGYPNALEIGEPAGVKVGQTADRKQVWTAGYTPNYLAVIWLGLPENENTTTTLKPEFPAGIWHALMQSFSRNLPVSGWETPPGISQVEVCDPSGDLPTSNCPLVVSEIFINGNEPTALDTLYQSFEVNRETGRLATIFTPLELIENRTYLVPAPDAEQWARSVNLSLAPIEFDNIQALPALRGISIEEPAFLSYLAGNVTVRGTANGDDFKQYNLQVGSGLNPLSWFQIGSQGNEPVEYGVLGSWDTKSQPDGLYIIRLVVVRSDNSVQSVPIAVTVDNTPPAVQIAYPIEGQTFNYEVGKIINLRAEASDAIGLAKIVWEVDGIELGENDSQPYTISWEMTRGVHTMIARAVDFAGNETNSVEVKFEIE